MKIYKKLKPFQEVRGADLSVTICIDRYSYAKNKKSQKLTNMENKLPKKKKQSQEKQSNQKKNNSKIGKKSPFCHKTIARNNRFVKLKMSLYQLLRVF